MLPATLADIDGRGIGGDLAGDADRMAVEADAAAGIDAAVDSDGAIGRDRHVIGAQARGKRLVHHAVRSDDLIEELARGRIDRQLTGIDHAVRPDGEAGRIREIDVAADLAVPVGIQDAVDDDGAVADDVDQRAGILRQVHVDGGARRLLEARERIVAGAAGHGLRRDRRRRAIDRDAGLGAAIGRDQVLREGRRVPQRQRHRLADQAALPPRCEDRAWPGCECVVAPDAGPIGRGSLGRAGRTTLGHVRGAPSRARRAPDRGHGRKAAGRGPGRPHP